MRLAFAAMLLVVAAVTAVADAQWRPPLPAPTSRTPAGPATLSSDWTGSNTLEGLPPGVLVGMRVTVGKGSRAGEVRFRAQEKPNAPVHTGGWVELPAAAGTYTFRAPRVPWDHRDGVLGIDQQTGGHAIVASYPCCPREQHMTLGERTLPGSC
jgi:hypothetical protein